MMSQLNSSIFASSSQSVPTQRSKNPVTVFFKEIIRNSGITLSSSDDPNVITQEQALVVRDIDKLISENFSQESVDKFMKGFRILIKTEKYLRKTLLPTQYKKKASETNVNIQQESLFRIFLKVDHLQSHVIDLLLDEITRKVVEEDEDTSWLRLLLGQLRYLPHIKKPEILTTKLLDIIEIASYPSQLEILESIPEILPDSEYSETAKELSKMLDANEELSAAIIDCLNALNLDSEIRAQVQDHILSKMLVGPSIKLFPVFLEFLMTDYKAQNLSGVLVKIRNALDLIMGSSDKSNKEKESGKVVIINRLQSLSSTVKTVSEAWLNVISNIKVHTDHKPVDLLILFMLHSSAKLKKRTIELTVRKKVKEGTFKCSLLEQFFEKCLQPQLLRDYFTSIIEVGASLLRSSTEANVTEFAGTLFKLFFSYEHTETIYRQEMLDHLVLLAGSEKNVSSVLNIFLSLLDDIARMQHHTVLLMRLLEELDAFDLKDIKLVFEILCTLICSDESLSGLKEEIHMIVRKQLSSSKRILKHRGIIAGVVMAKHTAITHEDQSELRISEESLLSVSSLDGIAYEAAAILELVRTSIGDCPELLGLYYDQLALMLLKTDNLDKHFFAWLFENITNSFQEVFTTETVCSDINDLQFSIQFNLNTNDEMEAPLAVNIAELTMKSEKSTVLVLASHFRLLRLLHYRHKNGDLSSIDALLGCGVVLPKLEQKSSLDSDQLKQMADCLFHCINWFREIISGFVTQKDKILRVKVIQRLDNLIELEKLLYQCLEEIPGHKLPTSYFDGLNQNTHTIASPQKEPAKPKRPKKKLKSRETVDDTTGPSTSTSKPSKRVIDNRPVTFREIDTDLVRLLKYPITFDNLSPTNQQTCININQLNFILKDFANKLALLTKGRDLGLSHLNVVAPIDLIGDCVLILPNISMHYSVIIDKVKQAEDEELTVADEIQTGFGLVLEILALIFNWSGFQHSKNLDLLRDILRAFRKDSSQSPISVNRLVIDLITKLSDHHAYCLQLSHGVDLIKALEALYAISPRQEIRLKIAKTSEKLLKKRWTTSNAASIDVLTTSFLSSASINTLHELARKLQDQVADLQSKHNRLEMLASVDKSNLCILYRNLWKCLHDRVKSEIQSLTNNQHLTLWRTTASTMSHLTEVAKAQEIQSIWVCFLKQSIAILKIFLNYGIPILEIMLKSEPDRVVEIFRIIQTNTRFSHKLCCHSKVIKSPSLIAYVPQFRLTLETLLYRVKAALVANGCSEAFYMGNLKNRDLHDEDIVTQSTLNMTSEENEDEQLMEDDEELEEESESDNSMSEVF